MKALLIIVLLMHSVADSESVNCDFPDQAVNTEMKLKKQLFCNGYDNNIRPGKSSDVTQIDFRFTVKTFDFKEDDRTFTTTSWMTLSWNDSRLTWSPSDYDKISSIHLSINYLWTPEIYLYNSHISVGSGKCAPDIDCLIFAESKVACVMPCEHVGHCTIGDYTNWPFDRQNCSFTFGSWMKSGEELNYNTEKVKLISSRAKQNNQWKLLSAKSRVNIGKYDVAPNETYPSVILSFLIERHSAFHISGTIVPAFILMLCNLTLLWMLPGSIERFVLCLCNLFSHFLYLEFLYWMLPKCGDSVPKVMIFFRDSQVITAFLLILTIVVKMIIAKSKTERPYLWIQTSVQVATRNRVGEVLLSPITSKIEDAADLVESVKTLSSDEVVWLTFCKLIDRVTFAVLTFVYFVMAISLLPEGYLTLSYDPIETLQ